MSKSPTSQDIEEEEIHFSRVIATFRNYLRYSLAANNRRRKDLFTIPRADRELIGRVGYKSKLDEVDKAIKANADFLDLIVSDPAIFGHNIDSTSPEEEPPSGVVESQQYDGPSEQHGHSHDHEHSHGHGSHSHSHGGPSSRSGNTASSDFDMDKLRSTIKQFVRDWSAEGKEEREQAYAPMKEALLKHFSDIPPAERGNFRVLVPGCGLARLAYDIAKLGFACQANEFSHYMLLPSFHILNRTDQIEKYTIYPYVHSFSNVPNRQAMLRAIRIPDVLPSDLPSGANFSLVAGDFEEIYGEIEESEDGAPSAGHWDAVVTCFFIDTAKNVVNYLRIIHQILAPGGVWINLGPLLWHFENNNTNDPSIELDLEEVKSLCGEIGFDISNERTIPTTYCSNSEGMLGYVYETSFWTATKRQ
ncbi:hypothetical protein EYR40_000455 [Pleurotus pulmonarius]|nr:hypothetical protein EYR36_004193 [Pleurotus pulmonarius]KAF4603292.1 hypothetical protein EYR38_003705 [Pleurotus pulmonarius]KAF4608111.1 hypothetical protein EYR40_000455 [Pleurotus pulmonarius]